MARYKRGGGEYDEDVRFGNDVGDFHQITGSLNVEGSVLPSENNVYHLGSDTLRWNTAYLGDLNLTNERGSWTIIEEENYLSIKNNKNGKRYKFVLEEIEDNDVNQTTEEHHMNVISSNTIYESDSHKLGNNIEE